MCNILNNFKSCNLIIFKLYYLFFFLSLNSGDNEENIKNMSNSKTNICEVKMEHKYVLF